MEIKTYLQPTDVALGDLDRDGDLDFVITHSGSTNVLIFRNQGDGVLTTETLDAADIQDGAVITDFDRDGWPDIAVAAGSLKLFKNNGSGDFLPVVDTGIVGAQLAAADLDLDGDIDLIGTNYITSVANVGVNNGNGTFTQYLSLATGLFPDHVSAEDLDRDGKPEIVTANADAQSLSVLRNITRIRKTAPPGLRVVR